MHKRRLLVVALLLWGMAQLVEWGFYELVIGGTASVYAKAVVFALFPLPFVVVVARRINGDGK